MWLFFALSGYLLYLPFARRDFVGGQGIELGKYAMNRAVRILPLYYVAVAVLLVLNAHGGSFEQWLRFATFTESFFRSTVNTLDPSMWSVAVEVQFYVLLPLLAYAVARASRGSATRAAGAILVLGAASAAIWLGKVHGADHLDRRWEYSFPATFMNFVPGLLLALLAAQGRKLRRLDAWTCIAGAAVLAIVGVAALKWSQLLLAPASGLLIASVVLSARDASPFRRLLDLRVLGLIGVASYSLYLWHFPIAQSLNSHTDLGTAELVVAAIVVAVLVSLISYYVVERPALRLRTRWFRKPPAPGAEPSEVHAATPAVETELPAALRTT